MKLRSCLGLALLLLALPSMGRAQAPVATPPRPASAPRNVPASGATSDAASKKPKPVSAQAIFDRALRLKKQGRLKEARVELFKLYDLDDPAADALSPRVSYLLAWMNIAQNKRTLAIYEFRSALAQGLRGDEAAQARAALRRMGVSEKFPPIKRRPRSVAAMLASRALMADLFKPTTSEWIVQTAITLAVAGVLWALILGAQLLAASERPSRREAFTLLGWLFALLALRAAGQFLVSFRYVLPFAIAYVVLMAGQFLAALAYGLRRLATKKVMDKGGIRVWGAFYTLLSLGFVGGPVGLGFYFWGLLGAFVLGWMALNVGFLICLRAEQKKKKGDLDGAAAILERARSARRLNDRSRFAVLNDLSSIYSAQNKPALSLERGEEALRYVHAWKSAEVMVRGNIAGSLLATGQREAAIDQLGHVWHLTETADCINGAPLWKGVTHGLLAEINFWRGWFDEADRQADLCLQAFPPELRATPTAQNLVAVARAIRGGSALASGDLDAAQKYLAIAPKTEPKRGALAFVHTVASTVRVASNDLPGAETAAREALNASPDYFPAIVQLARVLVAQSRGSQAEGLLRESLPRHERHHLAGQARALLRSLGVAVPEPIAPRSSELDTPMPPLPLLGESVASTPSATI